MVKGEYAVQGDHPKTSAHDVSYRSCLCALLIFIAICIIIVLCGINWLPRKENGAIREKEDVELLENERLIYEDTTLRTTTFRITTTRKWIPITRNPILSQTTTSKPQILVTKRPTVSKTTTTTTTTDGSPTTRKWKSVTQGFVINKTVTSEPQVPLTKSPIGNRTAILEPFENSTRKLQSSTKTTTSKQFNETHLRIEVVTKISTTSTSSTESSDLETNTTAEDKTYIYVDINETLTAEHVNNFTARKWNSSTESPMIHETVPSKHVTSYVHLRNESDNNVTKSDNVPTTESEDEIYEFVDQSIDNITTKRANGNALTTEKVSLNSNAGSTESKLIDDRNIFTTEVPSTWFPRNFDIYDSTMLTSDVSNDEDTVATDSTTRGLIIFLRNIRGKSENRTESENDEISTEQGSIETTVVTPRNNNLNNTTKIVVISTITEKSLLAYVNSSTEENTNASVTDTEEIDFTSARTQKSEINDSTTIFRTSTTKSPPISFDKLEPVCHTSGCKSAASRMLSLMNHSADACEDFYEFSCGGMQADNADSYTWNRLSRQLNNVNSKSSVFLQKCKKFYDTCIAYEEEFDYEKRLHTVKSIMSMVGAIDPNGTLNDPTTITEVFAKLILYGSMPLLDVDVDVYKHSSKYILQLTLPQGRPASSEIEHWSALLETQRRCLKEERSKIHEPNLNLTEIHVRYLKCNKNYTKYLDSLEKTLQALGYYTHLGTLEAAHEIQAVRFAVDLEILKLITEGPSTAEIRKAVVERDYTVRKVGELEHQYKLINWKKLFKLISGQDLTDNSLVQVYFANHLHYVFKELSKLPVWRLNNALLAIFANDLFHNLIVSKYNNHREEYCMQQTSYFFHDVSSNLYMKSLSDVYMRENEDRINTIFKQMILKLTNALHAEEWLDDSSKTSALKKAQSLRLYFPNKSHECASDAFLNTKYNSFNLSYDYQHNFMTMKDQKSKYFYALAGQDFKEEYTFCQYIYPFDKNGLSFYAKQLIAVPFGLLEDVPKNFPDYIAIPRIGIYLARQIAQHFDPIGIHYKMTLSESSQATYNTSKDTIQNMLFFPTTRKLADQTLIFNPSGDLSANKRIAENTALRLMTDSYTSLMNKTKLLPWISTTYSKEELFFVSIAQEYCQKIDALDYMLKVLESDTLPPSLRLENMMSNSEAFSAAFKCRDGSTLNNNVHRIQFPYFPKFEYEDNYDINE